MEAKKEQKHQKTLAPLFCISLIVLMTCTTADTKIDIPNFMYTDGEDMPIINGFFAAPQFGYGIPNYEGQFQTQRYYDDWVKSMSDIGASMLFYQWVSSYTKDANWFSDAYGGPSSADFTFYESNITPINGVPVNSWMPAFRFWTHRNDSPIQLVLNAGTKNNVKIWLGLYLNGSAEYDWWKAANSNNITEASLRIYDYHVKRNIEIARDLIEQFGDHPALGGFYLPTEIANLGFEKRENWDTLVWILDSVAAEVHKLSDKKVAISPFFNVALTPADEWGEMWDYVLSKSSIDIIMLQDGVGVRPHTLTETVDRISPYFRAVKEACDKNEKLFWANSELFTSSSSGRLSGPSSLEKVLLQLKTESEFTDTFVCFSYLSLDAFVRPEVNSDYPYAARKKLYDEYKAYYNSIKR